MLLVTEGEIARQAHKGALVELHQMDDPALSPGQVKVGVRRAESHSLNDLIGMRAFLMEAGRELHRPPTCPHSSPRLPMPWIDDAPKMPLQHARARSDSSPPLPALQSK